MLAVSFATALAAGGVAAAWVFIGPTRFAFAVVTHFMLMAWVSAIISPRVQIPRRSWPEVRHWEVRLYPALGVRLFGRLLDGIGWNRVITRERGFTGTRKGLKELEQHLLRSETGHSICMVIATALALAVSPGVTVAGSWRGVGWLVGLGIVFHLYPVALQRLLRARIREITDKTPAGRSTTGRPTAGSPRPRRPRPGR